MTQENRSSLSRRHFLGVAAAAALPWPRLAGAGESRFAVTLGYAAITWGEDTEKAIADVAAVGFKGIQLRARDLTKMGNKEALKGLLDKHGLELACFSSGNVANALLPDKRQDTMNTHVANAHLVKALGGRFMQVTAGRPEGYKATPEDYATIGTFMGELGQRTMESGVRLVWHNHMDDIGEAPDDIARVLDRSACRHVDLLLDIAHYQQGGGDPVQGVMRHQDRLALVHLKDVKDVKPVPDPKTGKMGKPYQFVELGRGRVDVKGVLAALKKIEFRGPLVVELDSVPDKETGRTAKECAEVNKKYVVETLGLAL
jgi:inosose dehydratase